MDTQKQWRIGALMGSSLIMMLAVSGCTYSTSSSLSRPLLWDVASFSPNEHDYDVEDVHWESGRSIPGYQTPRKLPVKSQTPVWHWPF